MKRKTSGFTNVLFLCTLFVSAVLLQDNGSAKYFQGTRTGNVNMGEKVAQVNISFLVDRRIRFYRISSSSFLIICFFLKYFMKRWSLFFRLTRFEQKQNEICKLLTWHLPKIAWNFW